MHHTDTVWLPVIKQWVDKYQPKIFISHSSLEILNFYLSDGMGKNSHLCLAKNAARPMPNSMSVPGSGTV